jgi:hypothetical protein
MVGEGIVETGHWVAGMLGEEEVVDRRHREAVVADPGGIAELGSWIYLRQLGRVLVLVDVGILLGP